MKDPNELTESEKKALNRRMQRQGENSFGGLAGVAALSTPAAVSALQAKAPITTAAQGSTVAEAQTAARAKFAASQQKPIGMLRNMARFATNPATVGAAAALYPRELGNGELPQEQRELFPGELRAEANTLKTNPYAAEGENKYYKDPTTGMKVLAGGQGFRAPIPPVGRVSEVAPGQATPRQVDARTTGVEQLTQRNGPEILRGVQRGDAKTWADNQIYQRSNDLWNAGIRPNIARPLEQTWGENKDGKRVLTSQRGGDMAPNPYYASALTGSLGDSGASFARAGLDLKQKDLGIKMAAEERARQQAMLDNIEPAMKMARTAFQDNPVLKQAEVDVDSLFNQVLQDTVGENGEVDPVQAVLSMNDLMKQTEKLPRGTDAVGWQKFYADWRSGLGR